MKLLTKTISLLLIIILNSTISNARKVELLSQSTNTNQNTVSKREKFRSSEKNELTNKLATMNSKNTRQQNQNKSSVVAKKKRSKGFITVSLIVLAVIVVSSILVHGSSKLIDHLGTYRRQRENLEHISRAEKNIYLDKLNSCTIAKHSAVSNRVILQNLGFISLPFKYSTVESCQCDDVEVKHGSEEDCYGICKSVNRIKANTDLINRNVLLTLETFDDSMDAICGWPEEESVLTILDKTIRKTRESNQTVMKSIIEVTGSGVSSLAILIGASGVTDKIKNIVSSKFKSIFNKLPEDGSSEIVVKVEKTSTVKKIIKHINPKKVIQSCLKVYDLIKSLLQKNSDNTNLPKGFDAIKDISVALERALTVISALIGLSSTLEPPTKIIDILVNTLELFNNLHDLINKLVGGELKPIEIVTESINVISPLGKVITKILILCQRNQEAAMVNAVFKLVISTLKLARSSHDYISAVQDTKTIENHVKAEFIKQRTFNCETKYNTVKNAIGAYEMTEEIKKKQEEVKMNIPDDSIDKLKRDIINNCDLFPSNCVKLADPNGKVYSDSVLEHDDAKKLAWLIHTGPISDIAVSTDVEYDEEFIKYGYFEVQAPAFKNKIFACRGCRKAHAVKSVTIKDKKSLTQEDHDKNVMHISYDHSLVYELFTMSKENSEKEIKFVYDFNIKDTNEVNVSTGELSYQFKGEANSVLDIEIKSPLQSKDFEMRSYKVSNNQQDQLRELIWYFKIQHCNGPLIEEHEECFNLDKLVQKRKFFRFKSLMSKRRRKDEDDDKYENDLSKLQNSSKVDFRSTFGKVCQSVYEIPNYTLRQNVEMRRENTLDHKDKKKNCTLKLQDNGLLATYQNGDRMWSNMVLNSEEKDKKMILTSEGELIIQHNGKVTWTSGVKNNGSPPYRLELDDRCFPVIKDVNDKQTWTG